MENGTESEGQRRVEWQAGDMRLVVNATTNKVMGVERRFEDADGSEYWRDAPNWPADALAQALIDSNVLARKFSPEGVCAGANIAGEVDVLKRDIVQHQAVIDAGRANWAETDDRVDDLAKRLDEMSTKPAKTKKLKQRVKWLCRELEGLRADLARHEHKPGAGHVAVVLHRSEWGAVYEILTRAEGWGRSGPIVNAIRTACEEVSDG